MNKILCIAAIIFTLIINTGCTRKKPETPGNIPDVVTEDIQAGIEKYIDEEAKRGKGFFEFKTDKEIFKFKLVRVHTEYLANLGPGSHFACVDLVDTKGDVYDVDFFMTGDPGDMKVTSTTIHKLNGRPFYTWKQNNDKTWKKVPVKDATKDLMGIITGKDEFLFNYFAALPEIKSKADMWVPVAVSDKYQDVQVKIIKAPGKYRELIEKKHGNKVLYFELGPEDSKKTLEIQYRVKRREKSAYSSQGDDHKKYLKADALVPVYDYFGNIAKKVIKNKKGELVKARAIYDHVIERMRYAKFGKGWGRGDSLYACDSGTGNCTDYHSYFISLARSVGIPARFAIGAAIPSSRNEGGISGYHCWVEFHAEGKWWPIDISEADKYTSLATYYFGHHPANRIELSRGRDLVVDPGPGYGPINFLAYPVFIADGRLIKVKPRFSFKRL